MSKILEILFKAADDHGEDTGEPDHSVGDLQGMLREAWSILTTNQKARLLLSESVQDLLDLTEEYAPEDLVDMIQASEPKKSHSSLEPSSYQYVIYSPVEAVDNDGAGYWSNENGWTVLEDATRFSLSEMQVFSLPMSAGNDARWLLFESDALVAAESLAKASEPLAVLSTAHLTPDTRTRLAEGKLSVLVYPNEYGGFIYVGDPAENNPTEPELKAVFEVAAQAGLVWLKFDRDAALVEGLPVFAE